MREELRRLLVTPTLRVRALKASAKFRAMTLAEKLLRELAQDPLHSHSPEALTRRRVRVNFRVPIPPSCELRRGGR
jgi:hypothetical protein